MATHLKYPWPVVWIHVRLDQLPAARRGVMDTAHRERAPRSLLSVNDAHDGSNEAVIKVAGWGKADVLSHRSILAVYGSEEHEQVVAITRRPGWDAILEDDV